MDLLVLIPIVAVILCAMIALRMSPIGLVRKLQRVAATPDPVREADWDAFASHVAGKRNPF